MYVRHAKVLIWKSNEKVHIDVDIEKQLVHHLVHNKMK